MASRHPLPYTYARAHTVLLEDEGDRLNHECTSFQSFCSLTLDL